MLAREAGGSDGYIPFGALASTLHYDFQIVVEMSEATETFRGISADVLLLGGSKSPRYLKEALNSLQGVLARARRVELMGLDHAASWNSDRGGKPHRLAQELRAFFSRG